MAIFQRSAAGALDEARKTLEEITGKLEEFGRQREARLLAGDAAGMIAKLDADMQAQQHAARTEADRIRLLEQQVEKEANARRAREKAKLIDRLEQKIAQRNAAGVQAVDAIKQLDGAFRTMFKLAREIRAAWPWQAHDLPPCMISDNAITRAIEHELYRIGARPELLGGMDIANPGKDGTSLPGGRSPKLEWIQLPGAIPPLEQTLKEATELASRIMRTGQGTAGNLGAGTSKLGQLLKRQSELAEMNGPEAEEEYANVVAEIAATSRRPWGPHRLTIH